MKLSIFKSEIQGNTEAAETHFHQVEKRKSHIHYCAAYILRFLRSYQKQCNLPRNEINNWTSNILKCSALRFYYIWIELAWLFKEFVLVAGTVLGSLSESSLLPPLCRSKPGIPKHSCLCIFLWLKKKPLTLMEVIMFVFITLSYPTAISFVFLQYHMGQSTPFLKCL